jgi:hypothetical protein
MDWLMTLADVRPPQPAGLPEAADLWRWLPVGYAFSVAVETPVLLLLLSPRHPLRARLFAGAWLTACTYPAFILSLSQAFPDDRLTYMLVGETLVPIAECLLFWAAFGTRELTFSASMWRDFAAVTAANLASFLGGEAVRALWDSASAGG